MAESRYTKGLKKYLQIEIQCFLNQATNKFLVLPELSLDNQSKLDLAIISKFDKAYKKTGYPDKLIGIEIEVKSSTKQIFKNYEYFKNYSFASMNRKGGLIHLISSESNISTPKVATMLSSTQKSVSKNKGFYYDLHTFDIENANAYKLKANEIIYDWEMQARLLSMISLIWKG